MSRIFRRFLPLFIVGAFSMTSLESCFMFSGKNNCGDCPSFKSNNKPKKVKKKKKHH